VLHAEVAGTGPTVVLIHGFTQSGPAWRPVAAALASDHTVVCVDAPGHGLSAAVKAGLPDSADLMVETVGKRAAWVGYSMGGRLALHVALRHPAAVSRLVLISTTAGIDDPEERRRRREGDALLAARVEEVGLQEFVNEWLSQKLFATLPAEAAALDSRLGGTAAGLASSLCLAGTGSQEPLWDRLHTLQMPVLVIAGSLDSKYSSLGARLAAGIGPNARLAIIEGAGHACHLERPGAFLDVLVPFLSTSEPQSDRQERAEGELQAGRGDQDWDEIPAAGPLDNRPDGRYGQGERRQGQQGAGAGGSQARRGSKRDKDR
jgi:2-succinyl-6-hydroxy-2,4-cyclohexadiene-1-carboxylate synthase